MIMCEDEGSGTPINLDSYSIRLRINDGVGSTFMPNNSYDLTIDVLKDGVPTDDNVFLPNVSFTCTDTGATLPTTYQFVEGDNGTHVLPITFGTLGTWSLVGSDSVKPTTYEVIFTIADFFRFTIEGPLSPEPNEANSYTVTCVKNNQTCTDGSWLPSVVFEVDDDPNANLPGQYTFSEGDAGIASFDVVISVAQPMALGVIEVGGGGAFKWIYLWQ
jgi:hypothetical protein